jgi:hypothetical protein
MALLEGKKRFYLMNPVKGVEFMKEVGIKEDSRKRVFINDEII